MKKILVFVILLSVLMCNTEGIYTFADTKTDIKTNSQSDENVISIGVENGAYTKKSKLTVKTGEKIKYIKVNGKKISGKTIKLENDGAYTIKIATSGHKKTFKITKDSKKPKISGVKNNKTYTKTVTIKCSDSGSGVYSILLTSRVCK